MTNNQSTFNTMVAEALAQGFSGWDFSWATGRWQEEDPPWDYVEMVRRRLPEVGHLLDMDTGGGEILASLAPLPVDTVATECYLPNVSVAKTRLEPLGVQVVTPQDRTDLPFDDARFELVINRHGDWDSSELWRVLQPGGRFFTQQVGNRNCIQLNQVLGDESRSDFDDWTLAQASDRLKQAGFQIVRSEEAFPESRFLDIGAVVFYLKIIQWQISDFSVERYHDALLALHQRIEREGSFIARDHRFLIEARKVS